MAYNLDEIVARTDCTETLRLAAIFDSPRLRGQMIDQVRDQAEWQADMFNNHPHKFGFRRLVVSGNPGNHYGHPILRLHVWEQPPTFEAPHTHQWNMASMVVSGEITNTIYNKALFLGRKFREVTVNYDPTNSLPKFPTASGEEGIQQRLKISQKDRIAAGQIYGVRHGTIHTSDFDQGYCGPTVTVMLQSAYANSTRNYQPQGISNEQAAVFPPLTHLTPLDEVCDRLQAVRLIGTVPVV